MIMHSTYRDMFRIPICVIHRKAKSIRQSLDVAAAANFRYNELFKKAFTHLYNDLAHHFHVCLLWICLLCWVNFILFFFFFFFQWVMLNRKSEMRCRVYKSFLRLFQSTPQSFYIDMLICWIDEWNSCVVLFAVHWSLVSMTRRFYF